jgi:hypothetical protein
MRKRKPTASLRNPIPPVALAMLLSVASAFAAPAPSPSPSAATQSPNGNEPTLLIAGVWPDRIVYFDQTKDEFTDGFRLRHGAVTSSGYTFDRRRLFVVTDRMESVEILDPVGREVLDEFKLSTGDRRIRISRVYPNPEGTRVYCAVSVVRLGVDRFEREPNVDYILFDVENKKILSEFELPAEVTRGGSPRAPLHLSPDGKALYAIGRDVFRLDPETLDVEDKLVLSTPLQAGYGPFRGLSLTETEPGVFYGIYRTVDPIMEKNMFGLVKLDLYDLKVETVELGPELSLGRFALSPDKKRGFAGLNDMVVVDMEKRAVIRREEEFERGRTNTSMIVSHDGKKLYISGVGDTMYVYDAETLEPIRSVFAGGDFMMPPVELPSVRSSDGGGE